LFRSVTFGLVTLRLRLVVTRSILRSLVTLLILRCSIPRYVVAFVVVAPHIYVYRLPVTLRLHVRLRVTLLRVGLLPLCCLRLRYPFMRLLICSAFAHLPVIRLFVVGYVITLPVAHVYGYVCCVVSVTRYVCYVFVPLRYTLVGCVDTRVRFTFYVVTFHVVYVVAVYVWVRCLRLVPALLRALLF